MSVLKPSRRRAIKQMVVGTSAAVGSGLAPGLIRYSQAQSSEPIRIGFQMHSTGIGAAYGRWYKRTSEAAVKRINNEGGINGRPVEMIIEDDGTDPKRGAEVVARFANEHKCDVAFGTLYSHVVYGSAPRAGELKLPYFVVSEGHHVASGAFNRYVMQPGITDVRSQVAAMAPFISGNLGKKITMIYPDFAFGHDHRDFFTPAIEAQGGSVVANIAISPAETSFKQYFSQIPTDTDVIYHVMVGPAVMKFIQEMGEHFGSNRPAIFGFIDSLEAVDMNTPGLEFLEGTYFWEGHPRYQQEDFSDYETQYRTALGVDTSGASVSDEHDISTYSHMFGCWETLNIIKAGMEDADYQGFDDRPALIESIESMSYLPHSIDHPQGPKVFNGRTHQVFGQQYISRMENSRLTMVHTTSITDTLYRDEIDYSYQSF